MMFPEKSSAELKTLGREGRHLSEDSLSGKGATKEHLRELILTPRFIRVDISLLAKMPSREGG
jgi:hypothetical protein